MTQWLEKEYYLNDDAENVHARVYKSALAQVAVVSFRGTQAGYGAKGLPFDNCHLLGRYALYNHKKVRRSEHRDFFDRCPEASRRARTTDAQTHWIRRSIRRFTSLHAILVGLVAFFENLGLFSCASTTTKIHKGSTQRTNGNVVAAQQATSAQNWEIDSDINMLPVELGVPGPHKAAAWPHFIVVFVLRVSHRTFKFAELDQLDLRPLQ